MPQMDHLFRDRFYHVNKMPIRASKNFNIIKFFSTYNKDWPKKSIKKANDAVVKHTIKYFEGFSLIENLDYELSKKVSSRFSVEDLMNNKGYISLNIEIKNTHRFLNLCSIPTNIINKINNPIKVKFGYQTELILSDNDKENLTFEDTITLKYNLCNFLEKAYNDAVYEKHLLEFHKEFSKQIKEKFCHLVSDNFKIKSCANTFYSVINKNEKEYTRFLSDVDKAKTHHKLVRELKKKGSKGKRIKI